MGRACVFWFTGQYFSEVFSPRTYGGILRSKYAAKDLESILAENFETEVYVIIASKPLERSLNPETSLSNVLKAELSPTTVILRLVSKFLRTLGFLSERDFSKALFLKTKGYIRGLAEKASKCSLNIALVDGVKGYVFFRNIFCYYHKFLSSIIFFI